jgi:uncharacterized protein
MVFKIADEFFALMITVLPYFIVGTSVGAVLEVYLRPSFAYKYLRKGTLSVVNASILGAILPGCSCATMPMADSLRRKGASLGTVGAFIMVSPLLSPITVILTYGMLGLKFTIARIIFSFTGAILLGVIFNFLEKMELAGFKRSDTHEENSECCQTDNACKSIGFMRSYVNILRSLGKYFLLGIFIASILNSLIPEDAISQYIGSRGTLAYLSAVIVGIPLYVCEGEEIPITLSLLRLGLGQGPSFSFLLASVGTCMPTMIMAQKVIGKRPTIFYILGWLIFAVTSGLLFSVFY